MLFFPGWTYFVLFSFPWCAGIFYRVCLKMSKQNLLTLLYSCIQLHELFIRNVLFRTKIPGVFSTKKKNILFILCRKFSRLEKCFPIWLRNEFHPKRKNADRSLTWSKYFLKGCAFRSEPLDFFKNIYWGNIRRIGINCIYKLVGVSSGNLIFKLFEELLLLAKTWRGEVGISLICDEPPFITGIPIG